MQRGIAVAAAYYEDKLRRARSRLHYAGTARRSRVRRWIDEPELAVVDLAPRPETGAATSLGSASIAGVAGALAGAS